MKTTLVWTMIVLTIVFTLALFNATTHSTAEDYTQWNLPEGAIARLGKGSISEIAYSPDGTKLAVAGGIGIWIYDAQTDEELNLLTGHTYSVSSVSFSPDGSTIASGSWDRTIRLWNAGTGSHIRTLEGHTSGLESVSFSPDGTTIASGSYDSTIRLWNVGTGSHIRTLEGHTSGVSSVSFSPDGSTIASGSWDRTIRLWNAGTGSHIRTLEGHTSGVESVSFSPDGSTIASGSYDSTIRLWNVGTGSHIRTLEGHTYSVSSVSFSPDGSTIASGSWDKTIRLWNVGTGLHIRTLEGHTSGVNSVSISPGSTIASGSWDNTIRLWDANTGTHLRTLTGHTSGVYSVAFSPDGNTIASGNVPEIRLWDTNTGTHIRTLTWQPLEVPIDENKPVSIILTISPDGTTLASGSWDYAIRLWDANTGNQISTLTGHTDSVYGLAFSPDGTILASGSWDRTIRLWNVDTGSHIRTLEGHTSFVYSVAFSPDGNTIASGSSDNTIRLWNANTGTHLRTLTGHTDQVYSVSFSPDGSTIASGSNDRTVRLWNVGTGSHIRTLEGHTRSVWSVAFSPDGNTIASGSVDNTIRLWDANTGTLLKTIKGHTLPVWSVAFSPDANTIASGSLDGTVLLWEITPYLLPMLQGATGFEYVADEWTLGLWHFDGESIVDSSNNAVQGVIEGNPQWSTNQDWNKAEEPGHAFAFDGNTLITLGHTDVLIPTTEVTVEAWVYPLDLSRYRLITTNWDGPPGTYHLSTIDGHPQFELNTNQGIAYLLAEEPIEIGKWYHLAGTYDSNYARLYVNGVEVTSAAHGGQLVDVGYEVVIGSKNNRFFNWNGLIDEVRISSIARQPEELSPNLDIPPTPVEPPITEEIPAVEASVSFSATPSESPRVGKQLMLNLNVSGGENIAGYQATIQFDEKMLRYVSNTNTDFLLPETYVADPIIVTDGVTISATSLAGENNGDGTLATLTFDIIGAGTTTVTLTEVLLSDSEGTLTRPQFDPAEITITPKSAYPAWDVNEDGSVNILDLVLVGQNFGGVISAVPRTDVNGDGSINILDLVLVAQHFGDTTEPN